MTQWTVFGREGHGSRNARRIPALAGLKKTCTKPGTKSHRKSPGTVHQGGGDESKKKANSSRVWGESTGATGRITSTELPRQPACRGGGKTIPAKDLPNRPRKKTKKWGSGGGGTTGGSYLRQNIFQGKYMKMVNEPEKKKTAHVKGKRPAPIFFGTNGNALPKAGNREAEGR